MTHSTIVLNGDPTESSLVGGKAFALNELIRMGATVPPTGAITTEGYHRFIRDSGLAAFLDELRRSRPPEPADLELASQRVDEAFLDAPMTPQLEAEIRSLADGVGNGGLLAVRSSATAEDMAAASFAGQYRSYLEIGDDDSLLRSVRLVWASLWSPAPRAYRSHAGVSEEGLAMAVVVMRLVPAVRAGVVFTVNPAGSGNDLRIEAVDGLAEKLVSGEVTPEAYVLPRSQAFRPSIDPVLDRVIATALDLESQFGRPQDVEWAFDGDQVFVVQSRPITTIAEDSDDDGFDTDLGQDHAYTTAGIAESLPGVLPPLQWTTAAPLLENGFRQLFDQMKALPEMADHRPFLARVRGRATLSLDLMKAAAEEIPGGSAEEIERQYFGRVVSESADEHHEPSAQRGPFKGLRSMLTGFREINARRTFRFEARVSTDATERLLADPPDCHVVPAAELLSYRHRALDLAGRLMAAEVAVAAAAAAAYRGVELFLEPLVGDEAQGLTQQLTAGGIDPCGAQVALHTCDLAEEALQDSSVATSIQNLDARDRSINEMLGRSATGKQFLTRFEGELGRSGSASVFAGETWAESRELAWQLISQAVEVQRGGRPTMANPETRRQLLDEVSSRFSRSWKWRMQRIMTAQFIDIRKRMLHRLVDDAVEFLYLRERTKSAVLALGGEVRRVHLELGHRLHSAGVLDSPLDVDLLASAELEPALDGIAPSGWELRRRRAALDHLEDLDLPQVFVGDPSRVIGEVEAPSGDTFSGWGASRGVYEGQARVVRRATEGIRPGEILVARSTDPAWTPLFLTAGAIVVEEGGPLSHAAIVARELGLPAVLNVPGIVDRLSSMDLVHLRVDGTTGLVVLLDEKKTDDVGVDEEVLA